MKKYCLKRNDSLGERGKPSFSNQNYRKKPEITESDLWTRTPIAIKDHESAVYKITAELNDKAENPLPTKIVRWELQDFTGQLQTETTTLKHKRCKAYRVEYELKESVLRTVEECYFLRRILLYRISDHRPSTMVQTIKRSI